MPDAPHVLIVEDELVIAMGLQALLTDFGFRSFAFASTARQALEQAVLRCPDLVTIDVGLMAGDGNEAVLAIEEACGPVPTVFITGAPSTAAAPPEAAVLAKPVSKAGLARTLRRLGCMPDGRRPEGYAEGASAGGAPP